MHGADEERRIFRFDEELAKEEKACPVYYHVGRGGVGNEVDEKKGNTTAGRRGSKASSTSSSSSSRSSVGGEQREGEEERGALRGSLEWVRRRRGLGPVGRK